MSVKYRLNVNDFVERSFSRGLSHENHVTDLCARLLVVLQQGGQQRGDELEGAAGDGVGRARVRVDVVAGEEAHPLRPQLVLVHRLLAQDDRQVLLGGNLYFCH